VREYPQIFLVNSSGNAERLIFKQNAQSMLELIAQIAHGKGKKTYDIFAQNKAYGGPLHRLIELKSRFKRLIIDDPLFGSLLLTLNILFLGFAWKFSGHLTTFLQNLLFSEGSPIDMESSKRSE
jgi:hypothetical protein